jgi:rod shape-determining protein MreC
VVLLVAQLLLLSLHSSDPGGERSAVESLAVRVAGPFPRLVATIAGSFSSFTEGLALRRHLIAENETLRAEVEGLRRERVRLYGLEHNFERLGEAVMYALPPQGDLRVADVIYIDHTSWLQTMLLWVGRSSIRANQPVVSSEGVVGRVILVSGPYAKVQLVTDHAASVGAMIARTRRQGVVRGADQGLLELDFVPLQADVRVGDKVLTAGIDGIYGRGIPIGTVTAVSAGKELFHEIEVMPVVDFGRLDQVYILVHEPVPESLKEAQADAQP